MGLFDATQSAPTYATSSSETPKWMQDAIYNQVQLATNVAGTPYEQYQGQLVAGLSPYQQAAYQQVAANQGAWVPAMNQAQVGTGALTNTSAATNAASPYLNAASNNSNFLGAAQPYFNQGLASSGFNAAQPYVQQGLDQSGIGAAMPFLQQGLETSGLSTAQPYLQQGLNQSGLSAAMPYVNQAGQAAYSNVQNYMNPYTQNVTDQIARLGARNLSENLLPSVSDAFVKAGQFGGTRMGEFGSRALRDTQESILNQQAQALQSGYGQAMSAAQTDAARQAALASTVGGLATTQQNALLGAGQTLGGLANQQQQALLSAGQTAGSLTNQQQNALLGAGQTMGSLANQQQQALLNVGQQSAGLQQQQAALQASLGSTAGGLAGTDVTQRLAAQNQLGALTQQAANLANNDTSRLEAAGSAYQTQQQRELDAQYQQYMQQLNYPKSQLDWLSTQVRGMAPNANTTTTQSKTNLGLSPLSQIATGLSAGNGLAELFKV